MAISKTLSVAFALSVIPSTFATSHARSKNNFRHRRQSIPTGLAGNWTSQGCYTDNVNGAGRTLNAASFTDGTAMTVEKCTSFCDSKSFIYSGVEFGGECYCDNNIHIGVKVAATDCNMACTGNHNELCGAGNRLNVFWNGKTPPPPPATVPKVGNWVSLGCYSDNVNGAGRTLTHGMNMATPTTIEECTSVCFNAGYKFAGTEFSGECYCDTAIASPGAQTPLTDCNMPCAGNSSQFCGGPNRLNLYNYTGTDLPPVTGGGGGGGGGTVTVPPVTTGLPAPWKYGGCWVDNAHGRIFETEIGPSQTNSIQSCIAACAAKNLTIAGTEFGTECYCGNRLVNGAVLGDESTCNMGCAGNTSQACGGANRLSVYSAGNITALPVAVAKNTSLPGNWTYAGCHTDTNDRVLGWQIIWPTNNTVEACTTQCSTYGYTAAGMEYGQECYCGDIEDLTKSVAAPESECNIQCPGDPLHLCGGGLRLQLYTWNGQLNVWHSPANTGRYEFFVPGLIAPLIATLGINDKVTFLEKSGTSEFPNGTGAYELDTTLVHNFSATWREMHVKSDVFCAGSIILPDKAGRQINVGGWSLDSTFGVRLYTPDGTAGVNGTNDWEEDGHLLKLQRGRWYPTAAMLPNGSVLVMGGEIGSNDKPQPNLEVLPKPDGGDTVVELDWLARTDPWNLYPFITVLPSGHLFVAYYNEARILDAKTFQTIKELPNMPAGVNNFDGGRTYPLEGAMLLFPQHAPYTDPLRVLICGGSTPGPAQVLDNCVSIAPEVANATWTIERMPSRRVMPNMVPLPDGTFMILNGAMKGVAGFGLANDPNLQALLYDPTLPTGQRISKLNTTIVPRLYHSEAILLNDARILVSGSDPQTPGFNEETRIEVYIPPYLNQGFRQPEFSVPNHDWAYGGSYTINNVKLYQGSIGNIRISLIAAMSSTHGNTMGSRTIFPAFSCSGTSCTITAPPNAFVSPPGWHQLFILDGPTPSFSKWVRIGGDPGQIGNWPQLPGFNPPGV
ncbi:WSC-domain-containing protein [Marasmius fiardii PR-910]|nr:WSC-domain-containing protein [Marasmius fiardii PR-910]